MGIFSYIYQMEEETLKLYLPDVALSLDGVVLKPIKVCTLIKPGLVNIKYNEPGLHDCYDLGWN